MNLASGLSATWKGGAMDTLTDLVLRYQDSGTGYDKIVAEIALLAYKYPMRRPGLTEDDCGDFLIFMYPRIETLVRRYIPLGKTFDAYLYSTLRWRLKTFLARKRSFERMMRAATREIALEEESSADDSGTAEPPEIPELGGAFAVDSDGHFVNRGTRKHMLLVSLKSAHLLTHEQMCVLARLIDRDEGQIEGFCHYLQQRVERRMPRRQELTTRRDRAYVRLQCLEDEDRDTPPGPRKELIRMDSDRMRCRFDRARREARAVLISPTHQDIADALGMPKGSVDSGLFYARRSYRSASHEGQLVSHGSHERIDSSMLTV